jgi:hypothetical protein
MSVERVSKSSFQAAEKEGAKREKRETHHVSDDEFKNSEPQMHCSVHNTAHKLDFCYLV